MSDVQMFHTNSLLLRPVKKSDLEIIFSWENDQDNWLHSGILEPYHKDEILQYVSKTEDLERDGQTRYMIELSSSQIIGCVDLFEYSNEQNMASVGLLIETAFRKKGYGLEALTGLSYIAKSIYNLKQLKALVLEENKSSIKLFEKDGYIRDDTKVSVYRYLNKDYKQLTYFKHL